MKTTIAIGTLILGFGAAAAFGLAQSAGQKDSGPNAKPVPTMQPTGAAEFAVDPVHSSVVFKIQHMGISHFHGRFNSIDGTYTIDPADHAKSSFTFSVPTDSVDTNNSKRDGHLKSPDFFNAAEFAAITFKSTKVSKSADGALSVAGDLTLHGVTKPVTVAMHIFDAKQTKQGFKGGFDATFTIKRTEFGMDTYVADGGLGDDVTITVAVEGAKK